MPVPFFPACGFKMTMKVARHIQRGYHNHKPIKEDITDQQWTRGFWRIDTVELIAQVVVIWDAVQQIRFTDTT